MFVGEAWADDAGSERAAGDARREPNPSTDEPTRAEFALHDGSPARLELDRRGGRVLSSEAGGALSGPGTHVLDLSEGAAVQPGIYFLRLTQGNTRSGARAAVVR